LAVQQAMSENSVKEHWHLSKSVPITLIFAIVVQTVGIVWTLAGLSHDLRQAKSDIERLDRQVEIMRDASQAQANQLARIEERLLGVQTSIDRLIHNLENNRNRSN
jgi:TolA-binding protein